MSGEHKKTSLVSVYNNRFDLGSPILVLASKSGLKTLDSLCNTSHSHLQIFNSILQCGYTFQTAIFEIYVLELITSYLLNVNQTFILRFSTTDILPNVDFSQTHSRSMSSIAPWNESFEMKLSVLNPNSFREPSQFVFLKRSNKHHFYEI